jgi:hypothetical protein
MTRRIMVLGGMGVGMALARVLTQRGEHVVCLLSDQRPIRFDTLASYPRQRRTAQWKEETRRYGRRG